MVHLVFGLSRLCQPKCEEIVFLFQVPFRGFRELTNRMTEDRCSQMLEECLTIKEELNRERLDKELLEQNRSEAQSLLAYVEKAKGKEVRSVLSRVINGNTGTILHSRP